MAAHQEEFICEPLTPVPGTANAAAMATGAPGLPQRFTWRNTEYSITGVVKVWKTSSPCRNGASEMYLRRHWYTVTTDPESVMTLYCDRQAKSSKKPKARWWVYTVETAG